jgi:hypothetical protein
MIESIASDETRKIYLGKTSSKLPKDIQRTNPRKLLFLDGKDITKQRKSGMEIFHKIIQWTIASFAGNP